MQRRLSEEFERCQVYLDASTRKPLINCVEGQLVKHHIATILERGFAALVMQNRVEDLARLYTLSGRVGALETLKLAFKENTKTTGEALVMDAEKVGLSPYPSLKDSLNLPHNCRNVKTQKGLLNFPLCHS